MPFTLAHPAIILPLRKTKINFSLTGLIIGSMVPDFEFFLRLRETENIGHHMIGIVFLDIPLAILVSFLFHYVIRNQFIDHLPNWYRNRFLSYKDFEWNKYFNQNKMIVIISIIVGIFSHLLWDSFTHYDGFFVTMFPIFSENYHLLHFSLPFYTIMQVLSSIIGILILQLFISRLPVLVSNNLNIEKNFIYWIAILNIAGAIFMARLILLPQYGSKMDLLIALLGSLIYSWIIVSIIFALLVGNPKHIKKAH